MRHLARDLRRGALRAHLARDLGRGALLALVAVTASCGGAASDAESGAGSPAPVAPSAEARSDLAGVAFDVRRDPG